MTDKPTCTLSEYGFRYGAATVTRLCKEKKGSVWIGIETPKLPWLEVYVTRNGKVRVFSSKGEWKPPKEEL